MKVQASEDGYALTGLRMIHLEVINSLLYRVRLGESETKIAAYELLQELEEFRNLPVSCSHEWPEDDCTIEI